MYLTGDLWPGTVFPDVIPNLYAAELATGGETGWDFSTRWFAGCTSTEDC